METNRCDVNHLDADALLPPRKRLLAGLKRQSSDVNSSAPSTSRSAESEYGTRLNNLLRSQLSNINLSNEEIVEASRCAAMEAAKVAEAARAVAEQKAAKAAKAMAAAKSALDLVATLEEAASKEKCLKANKMKKNFPRILKNSSGSDPKNHKRTRLKTSASSGRTSICSGIPPGEGNRPCINTSNGYCVVEVDNEGPVKVIDTIMVDLNTINPDRDDDIRLENGQGWQSSKTDQLKLQNGEVGVPSKDKSPESLDNFGKKRGRIKQKKLPLRICSFRDQTCPKEELKYQGMPLSKDNGSKTAVSNQPVFPVAASGNSLMPIERSPMWKCQSFKAPACFTQNKVMQS
ncbi:hypothetical protein Sango_2618900 [Sesamum angolense]|uniref:Uncharacterized protein n=1 Tax=Sesamum angolense TaxID=2727404 RepID=A0AAE1TBV6_9LAMI|nr:hypothetical protein Sango_2618900 [Sesamum angolense]